MENNTAIQWYSLKDFAAACGVSTNTFKKRYLPYIPPPNHKSGARYFWTESVVSDTVQKIQHGALHTDGTPIQDN